RDRMTFVEFDGFSRDKRKKILRKFIIEYGLMEYSSNFNGNKEYLDKIREKIIDYIIKINGNEKSSLRKDRKLARRLVNTPENKWKALLSEFVINKEMPLYRPFGIGSWNASSYFNATAQVLFASKSFVDGVASKKIEDKSAETVRGKA